MDFRMAEELKRAKMVVSGKVTLGKDSLTAIPFTMTRKGTSMKANIKMGFRTVKESKATRRVTSGQVSSNTASSMAMLFTSTSMARHTKVST